MRTIIAGSRGITTPEPVMDAIRAANFKINHIISGGATGVDTVAIYVAGKLGLQYPDIYYAKWGKGETFNPKAGHERNALMADNASALIAVWDGKSPGTKNMIDTAKKKGLMVYVHTTR